MLDQSTFTETIHEVSEIIRTSAEPLSREEILGYFQDMELTSEQETMVLEFLLTPHEEPVVSEESKVDEQEGDEEKADVLHRIDQELGEDEKTESFDTSKEAVQPEKKKENCIPESKMFQMYLEELKDLKEYSESELKGMYGSLLSGDESVIQKISMAWLPKVLKLAQKLATTAEGFEDVVQEGNMSLFMRLTDLCGADNKANVEQELEQAVEVAMKACISELAGEDDSENAMVGKVTLVNEAKKYLTEKTGKEPSVKELADYTKLPEEELDDILILIQKAGEAKRK